MRKSEHLKDEYFGGYYEDEIDKIQAMYDQIYEEN